MIFERAAANGFHCSKRGGRADPCEGDAVDHQGGGDVWLRAIGRSKSTNTDDAIKIVMRGATTQFDACQSFAARFAMEKWPRHASPAGAISGLPIAGGFRGGVTALDWSGDFVAIAPFSPRKGSSLDAPTGAKRKPPKNARCDQAVFHGGCATFVGKEFCKHTLHWPTSVLKETGDLRAWSVFAPD